MAAGDLISDVEAVLTNIEHASVATASAEGEPWNTPVQFVRRGRTLWWTSRVDAQHSKNIRANGRAFIVIYDSSQHDASGAAVYIDADVAELNDAAGVNEALRAMYASRGTPMPPAAQFMEASAHRAYRAIAKRAWTNILHTSSEPPWDERVEISLDNSPAVRGGPQ